jgi:plasmid stabilization system protein ParE
MGRSRRISRPAKNIGVAKADEAVSADAGGGRRLIRDSDAYCSGRSASEDSLEAEFFNTFQRLANRLDLGHFRRDLTDKPVRFFCVGGTYLVVYDPAADPGEILRVLHGSRDAVAEPNE